MDILPLTTLNQNTAAIMSINSKRNQVRQDVQDTKKLLISSESLHCVLHLLDMHRSCILPVF